MLTILHEPELIGKIHKEYLTLINFYQNTSRTSLFVKYFNINILNSTHLEELDSSYNIYNSNDVKFDVYDLTPAFYTQTLVNRSSPASDLRGSMLDVPSSITTYTIKRPRIHDLIVFYDPIKSDEIFRVTNIGTPVNALHSDPSITWFELELEYAPVESIDKLRLNTSFVYDLPHEHYISHSDYVQYVNKLTRLNDVLDKISPFYNSFYDKYIIDNKCFFAVNDVLIWTKQKFNNNYNRLFENCPSPYGHTEYYNIHSIPYIDPCNYVFKYFDLEQSAEFEYNWYDTKKQVNEIEEFLELGRLLYMEYINE